MWYAAGLILGAPFASVGAASTPLPQGCTPEWVPAWGGDTGPNDDVRALAVFDAPGLVSGPALYAGGFFTSAGGQDASRIAKWDGQGWSALGSGMNEGGVLALAVFDDGKGSGPSLYAGGIFDKAGGQSAHKVARWNGVSWSALGSGFNNNVKALIGFDDGGPAGPALYAGGSFGITTSNIAKWDGASWSALGTGMNNDVQCLTVFDDGSGGGPALYAGGWFTTAGGQLVNGIARWDGQSWSALGSGMNSAVNALTVFDDGSGPALYAGGMFDLAGGQAASRVAKWDGQAWSAVGSGVNAHVQTLTVFDDGSGPALYAGGMFTMAGGQPANRIAKWDGQTWIALSTGMPLWVYALAGFDDGSGTGPALYAGGEFEDSPAGDGFLAKWGCPAVSTLPGCFGNPAALASSSNEASIGSAFDVSLSSSQIASGLGALFFGLDGTGGAGCGLFAPGLGELLLALAPPPQQVGFGPLASGSVVFALPVPDQPALVGVQIALQGALAAFDPLVPIELSNGLRVTITQ